MSTYVTVLKIQWYLKLAHTYLYWIHKNLYHGYKNLSVAAMKKNCILQYVSNSLEMNDEAYGREGCCRGGFGGT